MNKSVIKFLNCLEDLQKIVMTGKYMEKANKAVKINDKAAILFFKENELNSKSKLDYAAYELDNYIRMIKMPEEDLPKYRELFDTFENISFYMHFAELNNRETYQVIEFIINRNIASNINENGIAIKMDVLEDLKFETFDTKELILMIKDGKINEILNRDESELSEKEQAQMEEFKRRFPEFSLNLEEISKKNYMFKNIIIDNIANITLEDIVDGINILDSLGCSDEVILKVKRHLLSTYEKNLNLSSEKVEDLGLDDLYIDMLIPLNVDENGNVIKDEMYSQNNRLKKMIISHNEALDIKPISVQEQLPSKKYLNEREVRALKKYIGIFYDTYHMKIRNIPNYQELFKVVDCMEQLEEDNMTIKIFLTSVLDSIITEENTEDYVNSKEELVSVASLLIKYKVMNKNIYAFIEKYSGKFIKTYDNPIDEYLDRLEEIKFYDESIKSEMDELYAMAINTDEDDYELITSMMREYLNKINQKSDRVSYEYNLAYKLNQV